MKRRVLILTAAVWAGTALAESPVAPGAATTSRAKRPVGTGVLNLNGATLDQIDSLPGISPRLAAAVVAERTVHPFAKAEEVLRVKGLSRRRFERLRPHLAVSGPTTFRPAHVPRAPGSPASHRP